MALSHTAVVATVNTPIQTFCELKSQFKCHETLFETPANTVCKGIYEEQIVAIKMARNSYLALFKNEKAIITSFNPPCPYIVNFIGYVLEPPCLILELMPNGDLAEAMFYGKLSAQSEQVFLQIGYDLAAALDYLHNKRLVYGDMKPENVLLDANFRCKLADFNATHLDSELCRRGTVPYIAPEVFNFVGTSKESDIYSYGIVLLTLASKNLFDIPKKLCSQLQKMMKVDTIDQNFKPALEKRQNLIAKKLEETKCAPEIKKLISDCTAREPEKRPSTSQIMMRLAEVPGAKLKLAASHPQKVPVTATQSVAKNPAHLPPSDFVSDFQRLRYF